MNDTIKIMQMAWPLYEPFWVELDGADDQFRSVVFLMALCAKGKSKYTAMHALRAVLATGGLGSIDLDSELANDKVPGWVKSVLRRESFGDSLAALKAEQRLCPCTHCNYIQLEAAGQRGINHPRFA